MTEKKKKKKNPFFVYSIQNYDNRCFIQETEQYITSAPAMSIANHTCTYLHRTVSLLVDICLQ